MSFRSLNTNRFLQDQAVKLLPPVNPHSRAFILWIFCDTRIIEFCFKNIPIMKAYLALLALATVVVGLPVAEPIAEPEANAEPDVFALAGIEARQTVGTTSNEFVNGGCRDAIWFFARGSTEVGNMVLAPTPFHSTWPNHSPYPHRAP
jgi:hypothetical protein